MVNLFGDILCLCTKVIPVIGVFIAGYDTVFLQIPVRNSKGYFFRTS